MDSLSSSPSPSFKTTPFRSNAFMGRFKSTAYNEPAKFSSFIAESTRLYPELPQLDDTDFPRDKKSPTAKCHPILPIYNSTPPSPIKASTEPELSTISPNRSNPNTPIRTLSMYRREQKFRNLSKIGGSEESLADLESENLKSQLIEKYIDSRSKKISELKVEVEKYNNIIYQSSRALDLCVQTNNVSERLEAEKILLVNVVKKNACDDELNRLEMEKSVDFTDSVGKVTFNKLKLLVKGSFFFSQVIGNDSHDYNFICFFICGDKVFVTDTLSSYHSIREASLNFNNQIVFESLKKDFNIRLDIYVIASPLSKRHHDKKITSRSFRIAKSKHKHANSSASTETSGRDKAKTNFKLVGYVNFTRENILKDTFQLSDFTCSTLLDKSITIDSQIGAEYNINFSSYLNFHENSGAYPVWNRRWCRLDGPSIYYWRYAEEEGDKQPIGSICLKHCVNPTIIKATSDISMRSYSFSFVTLERKDNTILPVRYLLAADIRKERDAWLEKLNKVLETIRFWEKDARQPMDQISLDRVMK